MWKKWFPWRNIVKMVARNQGFLDPIAVLAKVQRFAQPSEVAAPIELLRLATVLQARGLVNVQAIQHNLDWIWPYWVVRQFNPQDVSFIPRAFSLTHINLTNRNWTAVGIPGCEKYPIVDPRGLLTPFYDSWSMDAWLLPKAGRAILPSKEPEIFQRWEEEANLVLRTEVKRDGMRLTSRIFAEHDTQGFFCSQEIEAFSECEAWLAVALRPFNPEGVSEVDRIDIMEGGKAWEVNKKQHVLFDSVPDGQFLSNYKEGDVFQKLAGFPDILEGLRAHSSIECQAGMATAAAVFRIPAGMKRIVKVRIPLHPKESLESSFCGPDHKPVSAAEKWEEAMTGCCELSTSDAGTDYLYKAALKTLLLHTPGIEAFPGPYTYKHFWFRDAVFILHALLAVNLSKRAEVILDHFPARQVFGGHFRSQDGEWDSNGQVLWIFRRFCELTGMKPKEAWKDSIHKGVEWIQHKRLPEDLKGDHAGLFPAGFSAEHLGPNDFYYWDDFWGVEGLRSAAVLMNLYGEKKEAQKYEAGADRFMNCLEGSLARVESRLKTKAMPSSPYRRLDTGSVGSLAVGYPLALWAPDDGRVTATLDYLLANHCIRNGFFHEMSHSGINPYLTLGMAQILLRNNDPRYADLLRGIQALASSTGQWPEAIHPQTLGGCMGDGQHVWAAAEWILMIKACFVREECGSLILCSGVLPEWYAGEGGASFGKTRTPWGLLSVNLKKDGTKVRVDWNLESSLAVSSLEIRLPGYLPVRVKDGQTSAVLTSKEVL